MRLYFIFLVIFVCYLVNFTPQVECKKKKSSKTSSSESSSSSKSESSKKSERSTESSKSSSSKATNELRVETLGKLIQTSSTGVIALTDRNFSKYVTERPRDYNSLIFLTATDPKYQCTMCVKSKDTVIDIAKMYNLQYNFTTGPSQEKLVFFTVEVDDARNLFQDLGVESVPKVYFVPAAGTGSPRTSMKSQEVDGSVFLDSTGTALHAIEEITGIKIVVQYDPKLLLFVIGVVSLFLALFVSTAAYDVMGCLFWYQSPKVWSIISVICFGVGVSGSIFCIIRSAPPFGFNRQHNLHIFAPQGRDQYLIEGIIVSLWTVGCGLCLYLMQITTKLRFPLLRHLLIMLLTSIFILLSIQIWNAYVAKTMWYSLKETIPHDLWYYFTSAVKKNSGLLKRLIRLSEVWLFEVKDWKGLTKKFELLIVDYMKRFLVSSTPSK